ncbi:MAG TPA: FAD-dependent oxidoreductase, partial [Thiotrichaceae bacterium]|nr:FAD-dependent oxidoreductase [Thiotrichaceae bacterium]
MNVPAGSAEQGRTPNVLVVGGGFTGLNAAIEVAKAGYSATIVEKADALGGTAAQLYKRIPNRAPFAEPQDSGIADLIKQVEGNDKITAHLNAKVTKTSGAPGRFSADITTEGGAIVTENFGSIIQASGFKPYDATQLPEFA